MRIISLAILAVFAQPALAQSAFKQIEAQFIKAHEIDRSILRDGAVLIRGQCYMPQSEHVPQVPYPATLLLKTVTYPDQGPIKGQKVVHGLIGIGLEDQALRDEMASGLSNSGEFGVLFPSNANLKFSPQNAHYGAASWSACDHLIPGAEACNKRLMYIKEDQDYYYISVGYTVWNHQFGWREYSTRSYCYINR